MIIFDDGDISKKKKKKSQNLFVFKFKIIFNQALIKKPFPRDKERD